MTDAELNQALEGIRLGVCRADCEREIRETVRGLRADLATVRSERDLIQSQKSALAGRAIEAEESRATVTAERDQARRVAVEQHAELSRVTAERDGACEGKGNLWVQLEAERAAHAETRKALAEDRSRLQAEVLALKQERDQLSAEVIRHCRTVDAERAAHAETKREWDKFRELVIREAGTELEALVVTRAELSATKAQLAAVAKALRELPVMRSYDAGPCVCAAAVDDIADMCTSAPSPGAGECRYAGSFCGDTGCSTHGIGDGTEGGGK